MQKQFFGVEREVLLEANFDIDKAIIFLPGISGKAHSDRFSGLAKVAEDAGYACARVRIWDSEEDVQKLSYKKIFTHIDSVIENLQRIGFIEFALIGKSFGGGVSLVYNHGLVTQKILWAPAIGVTGEEKGTFYDLIETPFNEVNDLLDITVGKEKLESERAAVSIIHGTADETFPLQNSEQIAELSGAELRTIEGADHSFKDSFHEAKLLEVTRDLLK